MTQLYIQNLTSGGGGPFALLDVNDLDIDMTFTLYDLANPVGRSGSYSKTISIPATERNIYALGVSQDLNSFPLNFFAQLKSNCVVSSDGVEVFRGVFRLLSIKTDKGKTTFECSISSVETDFWTLVNDTYLTELDWSTYSHVRDFDLVDDAVTNMASFISTNGYCYPALDTYGFPDTLFQPSLQGQTLITQQIGFWRMMPCMTLKTILNEIHNQIDPGASYGGPFKWKSNFFDSTGILDKVVVTYPQDHFANGDQTAVKAFVGVTGDVDQSAFVVGGWYSPVQNLTFTGFYTDLRLDDNSTSPYFDDLTTIWTNTLWDTGNYRINALPGTSVFVWNIQLDFDNSSLVDLWVMIDWTIVSNVSTAYVSVPPGYQGTNQFFKCPAGEKTRLAITGQLLNPNNTMVSPKVWVFDPLMGSTTYAYKGGGYTTMHIEAYNTGFGDIPGVNMVPKGVKASDFILDLQKTFNLMIYADPTEPRVIRYEPYNWFYDVLNVNPSFTPTAVDWTKKVDVNGLFNITPGDTTAKRRYTLRNKQMGDRLSKTHLADTGIPYGQRIYDVNNQFAVDEQVVETMYGSLPIASFGMDYITGRTFDQDGNGVITPRVPGYRWAYVKSITLPNSQTWYLMDTNNIAVPKTKWPYIGHLDDPWTPTADLNFGMAREVYYTAYIYQSQPGSQLPSLAEISANNGFNNFYYTYFQELASSDALEVELPVVLSATDIASLNFRNPVFYDNLLWRLVSITGYKFGSTMPCRARLRRTITGAGGTKTLPYLGTYPVAKQDYDTTLALTPEREYISRMSAFRGGYVKPSIDQPLEPVYNDDGFPT
jgi:hypothetical protein